MDTTLRAPNGLGFGARPGERKRVRDPRGWLRAQLKGDAPLLAPPADAVPEAIADAVRAFRSAAQQRTDPEQQRAARQQARRRLVAIAAAESRAALTERVVTERPFV